MKTINLNNKQVETFIEPISNKYMGFAGIIKINSNDSVFVDTRDGKGYDRVIESMSKMITYLSNKFRFNGFAKDDVKQHIVMLILDGIPKFNPNLDVKLSTFLQIRVGRRLINEVRDNSRYFRNATFLNLNRYRVNCKCGNNFALSICEDQDIDSEECPNCNTKIINSKKYNISHNEILFNDNIYNKNNDPVHDNSLDNIIDSNIFGEEKSPLEDDIIFMNDLQDCITNEGPEVIKMMSLICLYDYSISDAAKEAGISYTHAANLLKNMRNNKKIQKLMDK